MGTVKGKGKVHPRTGHEGQEVKQMYKYIQGVPGGMDKTSGECSLC